MNRKLLPVLLLVFSSVITLAQEMVDMAMMQKIKDEGRNHSQVTLIAHNLTDVCGPRLTNSPGYNCALDWVTQICNQWGWPMPAAKPGANSVRAGAMK